MLFSEVHALLRYVRFYLDVSFFDAIDLLITSRAVNPQILYEIIEKTRDYG